MDIEGAELPALVGMKTIINKNHDIKIVMELCTTRTARIGYELSDIYDILHDGYLFCTQVIEDFRRSKSYSDPDLGKDEFIKLCERNTVVTLYLSRRVA